MKDDINRDVSFEFESEYMYLKDTLDRLINLKENEKKQPFFKKFIYIVASLSILAFTLTMCFSIFRNNFTVESILSTLLAFFSIFISIIFYFKADETSSKFYDSSYKFMKDISVTLGKIEERFGEKLNSLNDKFSHFERESQKASLEIESNQEDKENIINDLMERANLRDEEKEKFRKQLEEKDKQIEILKINKLIAERQARMLRRNIDELYEMKGLNDIKVNNSLYLNNSELEKINTLETILSIGRIPHGISIQIRRWLRLKGIILQDGDVNLDRAAQVLKDLKEA